METSTTNNATDSQVQSATTEAGSKIASLSLKFTDAILEVINNEDEDKTILEVAMAMALSSIIITRDHGMSAREFVKLFNEINETV